MVVAQVLVEVVAHAGVEDGVNARVHQRLHVAVHQLGGIAGGVRRDGRLPQVVELLGGLGRELDAEAQGGKEGVPEGQQLVEVQPHGQADGLPRAGLVAELRKLLALVVVEVVALGAALRGQRLGALVAADELLAVGKGVDGQAAVVGAALAGDGLHLVGEVLQLLGSQQRAALALAVRAGVERGAHRAHQTRQRGADDVAADLLLKGAQHGVV